MKNTTTIQSIRTFNDPWSIKCNLCARYMIWNENGEPFRHHFKIETIHRLRLICLEWQHGGRT
jgi:hypothetical protein